MKKIKTEEAVGWVLCHDLTGIMADGFKGVMFKRGHVVREEDIPGLLDIGKSHIFVWEPGVDEVHEDDAALALAQVMAGPHISYSQPAEGKVGLRAEVKGLFTVDRLALEAINRVGDYTVASLPNKVFVSPGTLLVGCRIVPLTTSQDQVDRALALAREAKPVFRVLPFRPLKVGVLITGTEIYEGRIQDRFAPIMRRILGAYDAEILGFTLCPDDTAVMEREVRAFIDRGADLVVLTGGMSVDPDDVTPTVIRNTGAEVVTHGVPMQPGNMLMMAYLGDVALVGVPGASMKAPNTSLDVFLPRIFAGDKIKKEEIAAYGLGGLCHGCEVCRFPYCYFGKV